MHRRIYFKNSLGQTFEDAETHLFSNLQGFGGKTTLSGTRLGNSLLVSNTLSELVVKNTDLTIWGSTEDVYQTYLQFARFIQYEPIYLYYETPNRTDAVFCQCKVIQIDKSEKGTDGIMRVPLQIQPLTFWYDERENAITTGRSEVVGKKYGLRRAYSYSTVSTSNIQIYNDGLNDAPMIIEVDGRVTDLQFNLYDEFGVRYGVGKIKGTYDRIVINSFELDESIELVRDTAVIPNPYNFQDLNVAQLDPSSQVTFLKLKTGQSKMNFMVEEGFKGTITIRWRNTYASV